MVSNYPHSIAARENVSPRIESSSDRLGERVLERLRHLICGLHGHDALLHFDHGRMYLRCMSCGHETPGWDLKDAPAPVIERTEPRRHAVVQARFMGDQRKIA